MRSVKERFMRLALAVAAAGVLAACAVPACAQPPRIQAVRLDSPPKIDGVLDDACWQRPADASEFWYRGNLTRPSEETEAWICYDASCIYVAFWCHDPQPGKIVAQQRKRGGSFGADDRVILHIDPWHSHQNTSYFLADRRVRLDSGNGDPVENSEVHQRSGHDGPLLWPLPFTLRPGVVLA
jgi:hypothetical protein